MVVQEDASWGKKKSQMENTLKMILSKNILYPLFFIPQKKKEKKDRKSQTVQFSTRNSQKNKTHQKHEPIPNIS